MKPLDLLLALGRALVRNLPAEKRTTVAGAIAFGLLLAGWATYLVPGAEIARDAVLSVAAVVGAVGLGAAADSREIVWTTETRPGGSSPGAHHTGGGLLLALVCLLPLVGCGRAFWESQTRALVRAAEEIRDHDSDPRARAIAGGMVPLLELGASWAEAKTEAVEGLAHGMD